MLTATDLGYFEQFFPPTLPSSPTGYSCKGSGTTRVCSTQDASRKRTFKRLQQALVSLANQGMRARENVWVPLIKPTVDGAIGAQTARAVKIASVAAMEKFGAAPSVPERMGGKGMPSTAGLSTAAMAQVLTGANPDEIARWAGPIANYIQTVLAIEKKWTAGMVSSAMPSSASPAGAKSEGTIYVVMASISLVALVGLGIHLARRKG